MISDGPQPVAVPNVVGAPVDQAKAAVIDAGLEPQVREKFDETVPAGTVISQSPEGNTHRRQGLGAQARRLQGTTAGATCPTSSRQERQPRRRR